MKRIVALLVLSGLVLMCSSKPDVAKLDSPQKKGRTLEFTTTATFKSSKDIVVRLAEAKTDKERNQGLMDVHHLNKDEGMIFYFSNDRPLSFWMANTPLSLDIIFINVAKEIVRIHHSTKPFYEGQYESGVPARYVIEMPAGFCKEHDILEGQKVEFSL